MSKETLITGQKSLGQTLRQTGKVLFGQQVPNYTIYFLDASKTKGIGDYSVIVYPYIELGRASDNVIQYGEEYPTVSRKHASMAFENGNVVITAMGKNPTYVNGEEVQEKRILQNGDEVRLSSNGPRIRFNSTVTNTSNMKFTQRMGLMAEQALKPYKKMVAALAFLLLFSIGAGLYYGIETSSDLKKAKSEMLVLQDEIKSNEERLIEMANEGKIQSEEYKKLEKELLTQKARFNQLVSQPGSSRAISDGIAIKDPLDVLPLDDIYFIGATKIEVALPNLGTEVFTPENGEKYLFTGTAFATYDNKLVSARHVFQPHRFSKDLTLYRLLALYEDLGAKITTFFEARGKDGKLALTFNDRNMIYDDSRDVISENPLIDKEGNEYNYKIATFNYTDWAYITINNLKGRIVYDRELSKNLKVGERLWAVGYTFGQSLQPDFGDLKPLVSPSNVAQGGLTNDIISVTNTGLSYGNSGGPVFAYKNGEWKAIGIVSGSYDSTVGIIVPVANLR